MSGLLLRLDKRIGYFVETHFNPKTDTKNFRWLGKGGNLSPLLPFETRPDFFC